MRDICLYAFFSDGLYEFAETFIDSLKFHHGEDLHVIFETLDLNDSQIERLRTSYKNLDLRNRPIDLSRYADMLEVDVETVRRWKHEVENVVTSDENYKWKILMSVEERYRSVPRIAAEARSAGFSVLLHADIDMYFRRPLDNFIEIVASHDVSITFREGVPENNRVLGAYMGFSLNELSAAFLTSWAAQIDSIAPKDKPRGFGQTSFYRAYLEHAKTCKWGQLDQLPNGPKISKNRAPEADIWVGNSNQGRNRKSRTAAIFAADLEEMKRDPKSFVGSNAYQLYHFPSYSRVQPSPGFAKTLMAIGQGWTKILDGGAKIDQAPNLDIFFSFLTSINELLQLNLCQSMTDLGSPNPFRYDRSIVLTDPQSQRSYKGVESYFGLSSLIQYTFEPEQRAQNTTDAVCVAGLLEHVSERDIPWLIKEAFSQSIKLCIFIVDLEKAKRNVAEWWEGTIEAVANEFPSVNYHIITVQSDGSKGPKVSEVKRWRVA